MNHSMDNEGLDRDLSRGCRAFDRVEKISSSTSQFFPLMADQSGREPDFIPGLSTAKSQRSRVGSYHRAFATAKLSLGSTLESHHVERLDGHRADIFAHSDGD
jgi:hypothetical protein